MWGSFFESWTLRDTYISRLGEEEETRQSARIRKLDSCRMCGFCCVQRTCVATPDELFTIAEYLGITVGILACKYMVGDERDGHNFLRFANKAQTGILGKFLPSSRTYDYGECIFLDDDNRCQIYDVRPKDARETCCWKNGDENMTEPWLDWKAEDVKKICPDAVDCDYEDYEDYED